MPRLKMTWYIYLIIMQSLSFAMITSMKQRTVIKIQEEKSLVHCAKHCGVANVVAPDV